MLIRMNHQPMVHVKSNCSSFLVILLCASVVVSLEYRGRTEEVFLRQLDDPATGYVDKDAVGLCTTFFYNSIACSLINL